MLLTYLYINPCSLTTIQDAKGCYNRLAIHTWFKIHTNVCNLETACRACITQGIRRLIKHKNRLFYSGDYSEYKQYRNKLLSITRLSKKNHFHAYFELNISNMKKTWQGINNLIYGKKKSRKSISCIRTCSSNNENGTLVSNPKEIPDVLNSYFSNIGANLANNIPQITKTYKDYLKQPTVN